MNVPQPNIEWAKAYIAQLNETQRVMLQQIYTDHNRKKAEEEKARKEAEQQKQQQQAILDLLTSQKPITIDVRNSSESTEDLVQAMPAASSSNCSENGEATVKDVLLSKMKTSYKANSPSRTVKPYRPRGSRERAYYDGHLYVFDKYSYDCKKKFYRCEKKACSSRIHTPIDADRVIHKVQTHTHEGVTAADLAMYDIDYGKMKQGHLIPAFLSSRIPQSFLTPSSTSSRHSEEEENEHPFLRLKREQEKEKKSICLRLPENFDDCSKQEIREIEMTIAKYLMRNTELRNEMIADLKLLPTFFPKQTIEGFVLYVAKCGSNEDIFEMITVKEKNENSIRTALQEHFHETTSRQLFVNISSKINVPLTQPMLDQWKSEEFIRVDTSKPNNWKIIKVTQIE